MTSRIAARSSLMPGSSALNDENTAIVSPKNSGTGSLLLGTRPITKPIAKQRTPSQSPTRSSMQPTGSTPQRRTSLSKAPSIESAQISLVSQRSAGMASSQSGLTVNPALPSTRQCTAMTPSKPLPSTQSRKPSASPSRSIPRVENPRQNAAIGVSQSPRRTIPCMTTPAAISSILVPTPRNTVSTSQSSAQQPVDRSQSPRRNIVGGLTGTRTTTSTTSSLRARPSIQQTSELKPTVPEGRVVFHDDVGTHEDNDHDSLITLYDNVTLAAMTDFATAVPAYDSAEFTYTEMSRSSCREVSVNASAPTGAKVSQLVGIFNSYITANVEGVSQLQSQRNKLQSEVIHLKQQSATQQTHLQGLVDTQTRAKLELERELATHRAQIAQLQTALTASFLKNQETQAQLVTQRNLLSVWQLLTQIQNLELQTHKGNVRVYCRVRPTPRKSALLTVTTPSMAVMSLQATQCQQLLTTLQGDQLQSIHLNQIPPSLLQSIGQNPTEIRVQAHKTVVSSRETATRYNFDRIFDDSCSNDDIYKEIDGLVQVMLDGENVSVLTYGQTGSGKTHTMNGTATDRGVVPRSFERIFSHLEHLKVSQQQQGTKLGANQDYCLSMNIFEVYNDVVYSLIPSSMQPLISGQSQTFQPETITLGMVDTSLNYKFSSLPAAVQAVADCCGELQQTFYPKCTACRVTTLTDCQGLLDIANSLRTTRLTAYNATSSRSHLVIQLHLVKVSTAAAGPVRSLGFLSMSSLTFVDLAGSEKFNATASVSDTSLVSANVGRTETKSINMSLLSLKSVFRTLKQQSTAAAASTAASSGNISAQPSSLSSSSQTTAFPSIPGVRDSVLTKLLSSVFLPSQHFQIQSDLSTMTTSGTAQTTLAPWKLQPAKIIMFANISQEDTSLAEASNTLQFATDIQ